MGAELGETLWETLKFFQMVEGLGLRFRVCVQDLPNESCVQGPFEGRTNGNTCPSGDPNPKGNLPYGYVGDRYFEQLQGLGL